LLLLSLAAMADWLNATASENLVANKRWGWANFVFSHEIAVLPGKTAGLKFIQNSVNTTAIIKIA